MTPEERWWRGKRLCDGSWAYDGTYLRQSDHPCIGEPKFTHWLVWDHMIDWGIGEFRGAKVDGATVGQFTGMWDKNGFPIFEGDLVRKQTKWGMQNLVAAWKAPAFCLVPLAWFEQGCWGYGWSLQDSHLQVVGNIYDNKELASPWPFQYNHGKE